MVPENLSEPARAGIDLKQAQVRTAADFAERRRWDALMSAHHCLPYHELFGKALRHIAFYEDHWLALIGWQAGAFKPGARDRWIGWSPQQQFSRLHLIASNVRFVILPPFQVRNLASRALSLRLRCWSRDMLRAHGCTAVLAETLVDRRYFTGASCRAANFQSLGLTRGFERIPGGAARCGRWMSPILSGAAAATCRAGARSCASSVTGKRSRPVRNPPRSPMR